MDLHAPQAGQFSPGFRFSDFYVWAHRQRFTGGMMIHPAQGDVVVMFREGSPCSVSGPGVQHDFLGELLSAFGDCNQETLAEALRIQAAATGDRPLLGQLLVAQEKVHDVPLSAALSLQTTRRLTRLFGVGSGPWQSAPGENERLWMVGQRIEAPTIMIKALKWHASDDELGDVAAALSEWAVKLNCDVETARSLGAEADDERVIEMLAHPRRLADLESHFTNKRQVRAVLRALMLFERVQALAPTMAVAIAPAATVSYDAMSTGEFPIFDRDLTPQPQPAATPIAFAAATSVPSPPLPVAVVPTPVTTPVAFAAPPTPARAQVLPMAFASAPTPSRPIPVSLTPTPSPIPTAMATPAFGVAPVTPLIATPTDPIETPSPFSTPQTGDYPLFTNTPSRASTSRRPKLSRRSDVPINMKRVVDRIDALYTMIGSCAPYELFGLPGVANPDTVAEKHKELVKAFNPELLRVQLPGDIVDIAKEVVAALDEAKAILSDSTKRAKLLAADVGRSARKNNVDPKLKEEAALRFKMGKVLLQKRDYAGARDKFKFAMEAEPLNGTYRAWYGWTYFSDTTIARERATEKAYALITEAALLTRADPMIQCYLGQVLKDRGQIDRARAAFKEALKLEPDHSGAKRELRLLDVQHKQAPARSESDSGRFDRIKTLFKR